MTETFQVTDRNELRDGKGEGGGEGGGGAIGALPASFTVSTANQQYTG